MNIIRGRCKHGARGARTFRCLRNWGLPGACPVPMRDNISSWQFAVGSGYPSFQSARDVFQGAVLFPQPQNRCRPPLVPVCQLDRTATRTRQGASAVLRRGRPAPRARPRDPLPLPPPPAEAGRRIRQQGLSCSELQKSKVPRLVLHRTDNGFFSFFILDPAPVASHINSKLTPTNTNRKGGI